MGGRPGDTRVPLLVGSPVARVGYLSGIRCLAGLKCRDFSAVTVTSRLSSSTSVIDTPVLDLKTCVLLMVQGES